MNDRHAKRRKIIGVIVLILLVAFLGYLTYVITEKIMEIGRAPEDVKEFIATFGYAGWLVALGLQFLQILVAFIPGELIETGMGYAFGAWLGTVLCYTGLAIGQSVVFFIIRKFGVRALGYFTSTDSIERFRFLKNEKRLKKLIFILFIVPGTPKDLFTYLVPLTRIRYSEFMVITLIARLPSIVSSTIGGNMLAQGRYLQAAILYGVTGLLSLVGMYVYNKILQKKEEHDAITRSI